ncbi:MAG: MMPL family transporter [Solirubrobacterales bacterium]
MSQPSDKLFAKQHPPSTTGLLAKLADFAFRRKRLMVAIWALLLVGLGVLSGAVAGEYKADYSTPGSESANARALVEERFPGTTDDSLTVVWRAEQGATDPKTLAKMRAVFDEYASQPGIGVVDERRAIEVAPGGKIAMAQIPLEQRSWAFSLEEVEKLKAIAEDANGPEVNVAAGGAVVSAAEGTPEWPALIAATIILMIAFGSVIASGLPIVTALFGLGVGSSMVAIMLAIVDVPDWAPAVASLLAIGVGIDYALLVLTRFRDALDLNPDVRAALIEAVTTAGRSVLVAGGTVVVAVMGLFFVGISYMNGVALATAVSVLVVMLTALTLLPALLAMLGHRVNKWKLPGVKTSAQRRARELDPDHLPLAARWSRQVQRRPWSTAIVATIVLLAIASPALKMDLGFPDASNDVETSTTFLAYGLIEEGFGPGSNGPLLAAVDLKDVQAEDRESTVSKLTDSVEKSNDVAAVAPAQFNAQGDTALIRIIPESSPQSSETTDLVNVLRESTVPAAVGNSGAEVLIGGATPSYIDQSDYLNDRLIVFISGVVLLSLLILLLAFRSPLIALKAGVMNMLSVGAAYGVTTLAAQGGSFGQLLGVDREVPIAPFLPVIMFAILFGLSMDYEVFLMSRVREEYLNGRETHDAVTIGLAKTARVITAAAAIMIVVFMSFALSDVMFLRIMGIGMAAAVLVDATIIRLVLVPALMQILGSANWWIPGWLDRLLPEWELESAAAARASD